MNIILFLFLLSLPKSVSFRPLSNLKSLNLKQSQHRSMKMMFSGIIEDIGTVLKLEKNAKMTLWDGSIGEGVELTVQSKTAVEDAYIGCSIAVNGVCLTAVSYDDSQFTVGLAPETLRRSNLGKLVTGSKVNLERALKADGRNSGHFVQGHVDCTGKVLKKWIEGDSLWFKIKVPDEFIKFIVPKGFICIDGTSLTVCDVTSSSTSSSSAENSFTIMLITHTQQSVIFPSKEIGDEVNLEVDVLGKLVERSLAGSLDKLKIDISNQVEKKVREELKKEIVMQEKKIFELTDIIRNLNERVTKLENNNN